MTRKLTRYERARMIARLDLAKIITLDERGRIRECIIPGTQAKQYHVILRRTAARVEVECLLDTGIGMKQCLGALQGICYHGIAAILISAQNQNMDSAICSTYERAKKLTNIKGRIYKITSRYAKNDKILFLVVNRK